MPVKRFGIYLAYGPLTELRGEGLGRLLAAFLTAATRRNDVRFVVACPKLSQTGLLSLCRAEGIPIENLEFVSTDGLPMALRVYHAYRRKRDKKPKERGRSWIMDAISEHREAVERHIVTVRNPIAWLCILTYAVILGAIIRTLPRWIVPPVRLLHSLPGRCFARIARSVRYALGSSTEEAWDVRLLRRMEESESVRLIEKINSRPDIQAWYSPTAFWPAFNDIRAPRLMCVPDMVLGDFPVGFAQLDAELATHFEAVERAIRGGDHFQTYSSHIKWNTLVDRYSIAPEAISVVPHACMDLRPWITPDERLPADAEIQDHCEAELQNALRRLGPDAYTRELSAGSIRFIFYATQFRPNKNLLTLLRAYDYLLRQRFIRHKLILTGLPARLPPVEDFIRERNLGKDVICLHGLSTSELAACYRLADLAVNPSLSEGGCPFTFTEALSVDTPVVMARIPVTEEVITDPALEAMLFDPYDWRDMANRMEWALGNRDALLAVQKATYAKLRERTWNHIVDDSIAILEGLAGAPRAQAQVSSR
jgi:glycosyltransferase involved in cell wall biosynthesis